MGKEKRKEPDTVEDHVAVMNEVRHITCVQGILLGFVQMRPEVPQQNGQLCCQNEHTDLGNQKNEKYSQRKKKGQTSLLSFVKSP